MQIYHKHYADISLEYSFKTINNIYSANDKYHPVENCSPIMV